MNDNENISELRTELEDTLGRGFYLSTRNKIWELSKRGARSDEEIKARYAEFSLVADAVIDDMNPY